MKRLLGPAVILLGVFLAVFARAATYTAVQNGDWNATAAWAGGPPAGGDTVNIYSNFTISLTNGGPVADIYRVTLGASTAAAGAGTLVVSNNVTLSVTNTIYVGSSSAGGGNGTLRIAAGATLTVTNPSATCIFLVGNGGSSPGAGSKIIVDNATLNVQRSLSYNNGGQSGSQIVVTNGGQTVFAQIATAGTNNQVYVGGTNANGVTSVATIANYGGSSGYTNSLIVAQGGIVNLKAQDISGQGCYLLVTNGGKVVYTGAVNTDYYLGYDASSTGNYIRVSGSDANGTRSTLDAGGNSLRISHHVSTSTNSTGNYLQVDNGGAITNLARIDLGSASLLHSNFVNVISGGLLELGSSGTLNIGNTSSTGNYVRVSDGGILQFATANPAAITIGNKNSDLAQGNAVIINSGTLSYRGITTGTLPSLTGNQAASGGVSTNNIYWSGQNTFRLDSCYATNTLAGGYVFTNNGNGYNYVGLEMVNGPSAIRGKGVTIGGGSLLISNITSGAAMFEAGLTNNSANVNLASVNSLVVSNGIVWLGNSAATTTARTVTFDAYTTNRLDSGTVSWNQSAATATQTVNGVVMGSGSLVKGGPGVLILAASNLYTGATTVSNGALLVQGSINSAATVAAGGTLGGTGNVYGAVVNGGTNLVTVGAAGAYVKVTGALDISGSTLTIANAGTLASVAGPFTLLTFTPNQLTGTYVANNLPAGWMIKYNNSLGTITIVKGYPGTLIKLQ